MSSKIIRIGTRESRLAVIQSELVEQYIRENYPEFQVSLVKMKTTGDQILDRTLDRIGGKGLFVKELDRALMENRSDLSVHSLKDMPMEVPEALPLLAFSQREDPRDVLVLPEGKSEIDFRLPIGCAGARRRLQCSQLFPEATFKPIRGNVLTRLAKLDRGEYGAIILAAAGLKRLGLESRISRYFTPDEIIPAAGQGILAIQGRAGEDYSYLDAYDNRNGRACALAERAFVRTLEGGCSSPVCAYCEIQGETVLLRGLYYSEAKDTFVTGKKQGRVADGEQLAMALAKELKESLEG